MAFGLTDRIGNVSSVGQFSSFGGTSSFEVAAPPVGDYFLSTTGHGTSDPIQVIQGNGAGMVNIVLPLANQSLGMKFMITEIAGNNIQVQNHGGQDLMAAFNSGAVVFTCLNNGTNNGGMWVRTG